MIRVCLAINWRCYYLNFKLCKVAGIKSHLKVSMLYKPDTVM